MAIQIKTSSHTFLFQIMLLYQEVHHTDVNVEKCAEDKQTSHVILSSANSEVKLKSRMLVPAGLGMMDVIEPYSVSTYVKNLSEKIIFHK